MKRYQVLFVFVLALLSMGAQAHAQTVVTTGPVTTAMKIQFDLPANVTVAQAPTFEVRLRDGLTALTALTGGTCVAPSLCTYPINASNADALSMVGSHSITVSLFRTDVGDSQASAPFTLRSTAGAPSNLKIIN